MIKWFNRLNQSYCLQFWSTNNTNKICMRVVKQRFITCWMELNIIIYCIWLVIEQFYRIEDYSRFLSPSVKPRKRKFMIIAFKFLLYWMKWPFTMTLRNFFNVKITSFRSFLLYRWISITLCSMYALIILNDRSLAYACRRCSAIWKVVCPIQVRLFFCSLSLYKVCFLFTFWTYELLFHTLHES